MRSHAHTHTQRERDAYIVPHFGCGVCCLQSERDSKEEILKAFKLFDDDDTVSELSSNVCRWCEVVVVVVVVGVRVRVPISWCVQGKISFHNLKRVAKELGENLTDEELQVSPPLV